MVTNLKVEDLIAIALFGPPAVALLWVIVYWAAGALCLDLKFRLKGIKR